MNKFFRVTVMVSVLVMCILLLTGCFAPQPAAPTASPTPDPNATPVPEQDMQKEYVTFEGETFTIAYHPVWKIRTNIVEEHNFDTAAFTVTIPAALEESTTAKIYPTISVNQYKLKDAEKAEFDLDTHTRKSIEHLSKQINQFTIIKKVDDPDFVSKDGTNTYEFAGVLNNVSEIKVKQRITEKNGIVYTLTYLSNAGDYNNEKYMNVVDKTFASFQVK